MNKRRPGQYGPAHEVASRRWDGPLNEMTETYTFANGWGLQVVTNLDNGVVEAAAFVRLIEVDHDWALAPNIGPVATGDAVPPAPDKWTEPFWFTKRGVSPDWLPLATLAKLCEKVAALPARPRHLGACEWFARCEQDATHLEPHPAFPGGVPACDRCSGIGR